MINLKTLFFLTSFLFSLTSFSNEELLIEDFGRVEHYGQTCTLYGTSDGVTHSRRASKEECMAIKRVLSETRSADVAYESEEWDYYKPLKKNYPNSFQEALAEISCWFQQPVCTPKWYADED